MESAKWNKYNTKRFYIQILILKKLMIQSVPIEILGQTEEGYSKFQSQVEIHRNYMTTFRADVSWSSLYALQEEGLLKICDSKEPNKPLGIYKMIKKEKELLDTFMYAMNAGLKVSSAKISLIA